jgi:hypothetical protein
MAEKENKENENEEKEKKGKLFGDPVAECY